jgi:hypothetical protein
MKTTSAQPERITVTISMWLGALIIFAVGPGLLIFGTAEVIHRHVFVSAAATATVVAVVDRQSGSHRIIYCPVYEWNNNGKVVREESATCAGNEPTVGQQVEIRFDPDDPGSARPDRFWDMYGELIMPVGIAGTFFTTIFVFILRARRKRAKLDASA